MTTVAAADEVVDPFRLHVVGHVPRSSAAQIDATVGIAHQCFVQHRDVAGAERADWLTRAADAVEANRSDLADTIARTVGKPLRAAESEVARAAQVLRLSAGEIIHLRGETLPTDAVAGGAGILSSTTYAPYGVAALITPFNAPINLLSQKLGPAVAAGNTVVIKPAPEGAMVTDEMVSLLADIFPPGWCSVVHGGADEALHLVKDSRVRVVSCTGGVAAGESILAHAGIKPVLLELGSNSPNIVLDDADLERAALQISRAAFEASGQQCISAQRVLVQRQVLDTFLNALVAHASALVVGDPLGAGTDLGPIVNRSAADRVAAMVDQAVAAGASLALDGRPNASAPPQMFGPTIVTSAPSDARLLNEEVFGPVVVVIGVDDLTHGVEVANDVPGLLQASCFTNDLERAMAFARTIDAGSAWINEPTRFRLDVHPFGGTGTSGVGREGISYATREFAQLKHLGVRVRQP